MDGDLLANLAPHLEAWWGVITALGALAGLCLAISGLAGLAGRGGRGRARALTTLLSGVLLLNLPEVLDVLSRTLVGTDAADVLSYRPPAAEGGSLVRVAVLALGLTGLVGVARGLYLLGLGPAEGGGLPRALVHLAGGILCVNFVEFVKILASSLGGEVQALVEAVVG
jgi:hypothetical protein